MKSADYYRQLVHWLFAGEISARELKARGLPPYSRRRMKPGIQEQIDFGAGAGGPGDGSPGADGGARARQPH